MDYGPTLPAPVAPTAGRVRDMVEAEAEDWHLFDEEAGWEVKREGDLYYVRAVGKDGYVTMTPEEFDLWRQMSPDRGE